ncbi:MAG TPA: DUF2306 domain-containing protein [Stackebrandtia sp.]|jgi:uncharacterized membrane protein YozB (DUF420 family)|uniref:DUF2306 domain-containing protein n=1 Tax=Stackebrandtia sp. TaxID=2023065 RepID=UPI002D303B2E|nr:DUF2306 domain-containing protein [Stackebrandtia sp.]HZE41801.1 DUF2306 domain-containing protein [Stackebrandtia sp.]
MTTLAQPPVTARRTPKTRWWRRPWIGPLFLVAAVFLVLSVPRYLTLDPAQSKIDPPKWFPPYYGFLVAHVLFASVAMVTCCMQIWPRLRSRHPRLHRVSGRVYVFGGVLPAGAASLVLGATSPFGPVDGVGLMVMAPLWITFTIAGFRAARRKRFVEHRKWMIRSFTLTMSIIVNRIVAIPVAIGVFSGLKTVYHNDMRLAMYVTAGITAWLSWTLCLLVCEWYLGRGTARRRARLDSSTV